MTRLVKIDRDPASSWIEGGFVWFAASDAEGTPLSVRMPEADWRYLEVVPRSSFGGPSGREAALTKIEAYAVARRALDMASSMIDVRMADRI